MHTHERLFFSTQDFHCVVFLWKSCSRCCCRGQKGAACTHGIASCGVPVLLPIHALQLRGMT